MRNSICLDLNAFWIVSSFRAMHVLLVRVCPNNLNGRIHTFFLLNFIQLMHSILFVSGACPSHKIIPNLYQFAPTDYIVFLLYDANTHAHTQFIVDSDFKSFTDAMCHMFALHSQYGMPHQQTKQFQIGNFDCASLPQSYQRLTCSSLFLCLAFVITYSSSFWFGNGCVPTRF